MRDDFDITTEVSEASDAAVHPVSESSQADEAYVPFASLPLLDGLRASD